MVTGIFIGLGIGAVVGGLLFVWFLLKLAKGIQF